VTPEQKRSLSRVRAAFEAMTQALAPDEPVALPLPESRLKTMVAWLKHTFWPLE